MCMRKWPSILTWWSHSLPPLQLPPRFPQTSPEFLCYISNYRLVISTWTFCKFFRPIYSRSFQSPFILWVCSSSVNDAAIHPISDPSQRARFTSNSFLFYPHIQLATLNSPAFLCPPPIDTALIQAFMLFHLDYCNIVLIQWFPDLDFTPGKFLNMEKEMEKGVSIVTNFLFC